MVSFSARGFPFFFFFLPSFSTPVAGRKGMMEKSVMLVSFFPIFLTFTSSFLLFSHSNSSVVSCWPLLRGWHRGTWETLTLNETVSLWRTHSADLWSQVAWKRLLPPWLCPPSPQGSAWFEQTPTPCHHCPLLCHFLYFT